MYGATQLITTFGPLTVVVGAAGTLAIWAQSIETYAGILKPTVFLAYTLKL